MSSWLKKHGMKIGIKFTEPLVGDVSGLTPEPVGGYRLDDEPFCPAETDTYSSSGYFSSYTHDRAFDGNTSSFWRSSTTTPPVWIQVDLGEGNEKMAGSFRWYVSSFRPKDFVLQGSNDESNWDTLIDDQSPNSSGWHQFECLDNEIAYRYYRWVLSSKWSSYFYIYEIELYGRLPVGNEQAFTITGQEPKWVKFPSEELGPFIDGDYEIETVEPYPDEDPTKILLTMKPLKRFQNLEGNLTVNYDAGLGNLKGLGGIVQSFEEVFTPEDLERVPNPLIYEIIAVAIEGYDLILTRLYHMVVGDGDWPTNDSRSIKYIREYDPGPPEVLEQQKGLWGETNNEHLDVSITNYSLELIHIDNIEP